jgi:hypothetical protein
MYPARAATCAWSSAPGEKRVRPHRSLLSPVVAGDRTAGKGPGRLRRARDDEGLTIDAGAGFVA